MPNGIDRTYIKDLEDSGEISSPSSDRIFITLGAKERRSRIPFALFDDLLDRSHSSITMSSR